MESGLLNAADGSARWSQDKTEVLASVNGPRQVAAYKVCLNPPPSSRLARWCALRDVVLAALRGGDAGGGGEDCDAHRRVQIGR